jgi:hypothetical protein
MKLPEHDARKALAFCTGSRSPQLARNKRLSMTVNTSAGMSGSGFAVFILIAGYLLK